MKPLSILGWYRVLRGRHQWTIFQSVRYALWLARERQFAYVPTATHSSH